LINKVDRLILELKLPPQDAYYKLLQTLEEVNGLIAVHTPVSTTDSNNNENNQKKPLKLSPELGNVCFASAQHGWSFTLLSFATLYCQRYPKFPLKPEDLAKRLWGDWFFNSTTNALTKTKNNSSGNITRTFIQFIMEPLYKIYSHILSESKNELFLIFKQLNIKLKTSEFSLDPKPLLNLSLQKFFGLPKGFISMIVGFIPSPIENARNKMESIYSGPIDSNPSLQAALSCSSSSSHNNSRTPLIANVMKLYNSPDGQRFFALTRIYSGTLKAGQKIKILGESYSEDDDEDMAVAEVTGISVSVGRFSIDVNSVIAGNIVLLSGIDHSIKKTATIIDFQSNSSSEDSDNFISIFRPLKFDLTPIMKLAVEPFIPSELPKMIEGLRRINKTYPSVITKVEESGEHIILGNGELQMDCMMHDLRHLFSDIEIKVADPSVTFCETVIESSSINVFTETPNKKNRLTMLSESLENGLSSDIENRNVVLKDWDPKRVSTFFRTNYDWDLLTSRSIWAFGPEEDSPNILLNNTIPTEVEQSLLFNIKDSIVQGFKWGTREGPLCDEPIRNVKFRLLDATISKEPIYRGGGQIIPTARRCIYSSFLLATPRIMEPVYLVDIQAPADVIQSIYPVLARRRGHVVQDTPKPGAPFYTVKAFLPVMDR
jgi:U5 small nuclear ribonucleoprotein component